MRTNESRRRCGRQRRARVKVAAFGIGAFIAGLGGSLLAYQQQTVTFEAFSAMASVTFFATVYLCGATSISGGLLAGLVAANGIGLHPRGRVCRHRPVVPGGHERPAHPHGRAQPRGSSVRALLAGAAPQCHRLSGRRCVTADVDAGPRLSKDRRGDAAPLLDSVGVAYGVCDCRRRPCR